MKPDRRKYPLGKVLDRAGGLGEDYHVLTDFLECGHTLATPQDIIGHYYPEKRRCYKCAKGSPKDFTPPEKK